MAKGAISATATAGEIVGANEFRHEVVLQHISGDPVFLAFGDDTPVVDEGLVLSALFPVVVIDGYRATLAVKGICDTGDTATGTYSTS